MRIYVIINRLGNTQFVYTMYKALQLNQRPPLRHLGDYTMDDVIFDRVRYEDLPLVFKQ